MITAEQLAQAESNGHSIFGASGWDRKTSCHGSLFAELGMPDTSGIDAATGTVYHGIAEGKLRSLIKGSPIDDYVPHFPGDTIRQNGFDIEITKANLEYVQEYVDWCFAEPGMQFVEQKVEISEWCPIPKQFGIVDHAACQFGHLTISDLKFGEGVQIYADHNKQATGYALGMIREWNWLFRFETVTIRICQPRLGHFDVWETTVEELEEFGEQIKADLAKCMDPNAVRVPTRKNCMFCRAKRVCPAALALAEKLMDGVFEDETVTPADMDRAVANLTDAGVWIPPVMRALKTRQLEQWVKHRKLIEDSLKAAWNELQSRLLAGEELEDWFMAEGAKTRSIKSVPDLVELAAENGIEARKLIKTEVLSPAALEELFVVELHVKKKTAKDLLAPVIVEHPGNPAMALKSSGRKPALNLADATFEDESSDGDDL